MYSNVLNYRGKRYLWLALALTLASIALYLSQATTLPPNGGSWQGYVLGSLALMIMLWLSWLGIRKRRYQSGLGSLQGWTSAHIYLGIAVPVIATLHSAFQFGLNVHTLAWVLMCLVVLSGSYGLYAYLRHPRTLVGNRANQSFNERLADLADADQQALALSAQCAPDVDAVINSCIERSALGGGFFDQLLERDKSTLMLPGQRGEQLQSNRNQNAATNYIADSITHSSKPGEAQRLQELLAIVVRRRELLRRLRREISLQLRLKVWLSIHIPATISLLAALLVHIFTVFFYW